jgi:hypothetical protein
LTQGSSAVLVGTCKSLRVSLETGLADALGTAHVLTDPGLTSSYTVDWTGRFVGSARAVVRPATT